MKLHLRPLCGKSGLSMFPAFSLVELLVTISLIVILVAILLPSFGHARMQAKRARWNSYSKNLRADADALVYYAFDGEGEGNLIENRANSQAFNEAAKVDPRHFDLTLMKEVTDEGVAYEVEEANSLWVNGRWSGKHGVYFNRESGNTDWAQSRAHAGTVIGGQDMTFYVSFAYDKTLVADTPLGLMGVGNVGESLPLGQKPWYLDILQPKSASSKAYFSMFDGTDTIPYESGEINFFSNRFNQLVMSYSGRRGVLSWYLNGKKISEKSGIPPKLDFNKDLLSLNLGVVFDQNIAGDHHFFRGIIDEAGIFLRAWDEEEAQSMAENGGVWRD